VGTQERERGREKEGEREGSMWGHSRERESKRGIKVCQVRQLAGHQKKYARRQFNFFLGLWIEKVKIYKKL
jgi:hypothetical protein